MTFWYDHTNNNNSSSRPFVYPNSPFNQSNWISEHLSAFQPPTLSSPPPYMYMPTYYYAGEGLMEPPQQFQLNRPMYFKENGDPQPKKTEMDSKFEGNNNNHDEVPKLNMMRWGKPNGEQLQSYPTPNNAPYRPLSIKNRLRTSVTIPITFVNHPRKIEKNEIERPALRCIKNILGDGNCMFRAIAIQC
ncbi:hypothetical protein ACOME3_005458 [Neoechinorhynchus agilis]